MVPAGTSVVSMRVTVTVSALAAAGSCFAPATLPAAATLSAEANFGGSDSSCSHLRRSSWFGASGDKAFAMASPWRSVLPGQGLFFILAPARGGIVDPALPMQLRRAACCTASIEPNDCTGRAVAVSAAIGSRAVVSSASEFASAASTIPSSAMACCLGGSGWASAAPPALPVTLARVT